MMKPTSARPLLRKITLPPPSYAPSSKFFSGHHNGTCLQRQTAPVCQHPRLVISSTVAVPNDLVPTAGAATTTRVLRSYHTNGDRVKRDDPFATLGLTWGATTSEIKDAYRRLSRELHPDVTELEDRDAAITKFQRVQTAYGRLMDVKTNGIGSGGHDDRNEEFSFQVWRKGDVLAQERTDVAGTLRRRPVRPAGVEKMAHRGFELGQPDGTGVRTGRGEYLGDGNDGRRGRGGPRSGTVGSGRSKWKTPPKFVPWNPEESKR